MIFRTYLASVLTQVGRSWTRSKLPPAVGRNQMTSITSISPAAQPEGSNKQRFADLYEKLRGEGQKAPWDTAAPQAALAAVAKCFKGRVLDIGCGLGDNAIWLGGLPDVESVTGIDYSPIAVEEAKKRLAQLASPPRAHVHFEQGDALELDPQAQYDTVLDSAVFHCIGGADQQRKYLASLTACVKVGGKAVMLVFSDQNPDPWQGPTRVNAEYARSCWTAAGWQVESMDCNVTVDDTWKERPTRHGILMVATKL